MAASQFDVGVNLMAGSAAPVNYFTLKSRLAIERVITFS